MDLDTIKCPYCSSFEWKEFLAGTRQNLETRKEIVDIGVRLLMCTSCHGVYGELEIHDSKAVDGTGLFRIVVDSKHLNEVKKYWLGIEKKQGGVV